jgi:aspartyl-tRNA(Asn)/glutamyl-tRNA(Gln) amidotransferase subunit A
VLVDADGARERARSAPDGPLRGVPVGVKDLFDVRGQLTRAGSQVPPGPPAERDAPAVARLRAAGAVVLGRTRTHEFAWGVTTQHEVLGGTRNPWDLSRVPGGSSGGSAAAVAAGIVPLALGTDTGCSIRLPAAWCGLVGHKPTYGTVSLEGCVPLAASLDHGGALVRTVADQRLALQVLAGLDLAPGEVRGLRVGIVRGPVEPGVGAVLEQAYRAAGRLGLHLSAAEQPQAAGLVDVYSGVQGGEALAWHRSTGRWPASADLYGESVRRSLTVVSGWDPQVAADAAQARARLRAETADLFRTVDLLLLPVSGCGPGRLDEPARRGQVLDWTVLANLCGLPACSVPVGLDPDGLPVGLQVVGPPGADGRVLDLAERLHVPLA